MKIRILSLFLGLILGCSPGYALIPNTISSNYTVSASDVCNGACTIMPNCTLTVNNGAIARFRDIVVMPQGVLNISYATVSMLSPDSRIVLRGYFGNGPAPPAILGALLTGDHALITGEKHDWNWSGIETMRGTTGSANIFVDLLKASSVYLEYSTVEYAKTAIRNYDSGNPNINATSGGAITPLNTTFRNNIRSISIYNSTHAGSITDPLGINGTDWNALFQYCSFINTVDFNPGVPIPDMVYLNNCKNTVFFSCSFNGNLQPGVGFSTTGINAINSSMRVQPYVYNTNAPRCVFQRLKTGISVINGLQTDRWPLIRNSDFYCTYGISLSGCLNPWIIGSKFTVNNDPTYFGIFLNNCTGYHVEGNTLGGDVAGPAIVVKNSGSAYNEIYRNNIGLNAFSSLLGVQSIGRNCDNSYATGLKILCNNIKGHATGYEVSVMRDPAMTLNGVANYQFVSGSTNLSAGNWFNNTQVPQTGYPYPSYFIGPATNNISQFRYGRNSSVALETPLYRNFPNIINTSSNSCPVHTPSSPPPPFPFALFVSRLADIEAHISSLEGNTNPTESDKIELDGVLAAHALLIDSVVAPYLDSNKTDSIAIVYEQVTKGYQYKLYLASAYMDLGRYNDAVTLLNNLPASYDLSTEEAEQVGHIADLYGALNWLSLNDYDWVNMPEPFKQQVYQYGQEDLMFAGAIARSLLEQYQDRSYDPEFIAPEPEPGTMSFVHTPDQKNKIYPNPASDQLSVRFNGDKAVLVLTDIRNRDVLVKELGNSYTQVSIAKLVPGIYMAAIKTGGKIVYQQKVVKL